MTRGSFGSDRLRGAGLVRLGLAAALAGQGAQVYGQGPAVPMLEEVIVTAQKREQNLQDVPIAVEAFSETRIDDLIAQDIGDIGIFTTNVNVGRGVNQPQYSIRGIGTSDFGVGADPAVGVYLDGVYIGRSGGSKSAFNDIERVEILNGPQGTLFGRNAAAGAIQYVMNKPVAERLGWAKLTAGKYDRLQVEGVHNQPLTDQLFWRVSGLYNQRDGYVDNQYNGDDLAREGNWSAVSSLRWEPTEAFDALWRLEYDEIDQDSRPSSSAVFGPRDNGAAFRKVENDGKHDETRELYGTSLHLNYDFDWAALTSITSYRRYNTENPEEKDGSAELYYRFDDLNAENNDQWSQELRFNGDIGDRITWVAGANYHWENAKQRSGIMLSPQAVDKLIVEREVGLPYSAVPPGFGFDAAFLAGFPGEDRIYSNGAEALLAPEYTENVDVHGRYESWAGFTDITWSVTEKLDLTAGVRFTRDDKEFGRRVEFNDFGIAFAFTEETLVNEQGQLDPEGEVGYFYQSESWSETTPRLVANYRFTDDVMVYASWAEGYKAGGFNSAGERNDDPAFDPEEVKNIEVGFKTTWLDNTLRVNGAYFDYTYDNLQSLRFIPGECIGGGATTGQYQFETSDIEGDGVELSLSWLPLPELELWFNTGTLDAEYSRRERRRVVDGQCEVIDDSGEKFAESPDLNYNVGGKYTWTFGGGSQLALALAWHYADGAEDRKSCTYIEDNGDGTSSIYGLDTIDGVLTIVDPSATGSLTEPPVDACPDLRDEEMLNARLAWTSADGAWEVAAWVTNATDWEPEGDPGGLGGELASDFSDGSPSWDRREEPRMYGMELRYSY